MNGLFTSVKPSTSISGLGIGNGSLGVKNTQPGLVLNNNNIFNTIKPIQTGPFNPQQVQVINTNTTDSLNYNPGRV
jgi:hypothetical protein